MEAFVLFATFFVLIIVGAPIAVALGGSVVVASTLFSPIPLAVLGQKVYANLNHFTLMAVPFFFFAAAFMESGGLVRRLVGLANALVGHLRGGLGMTAVLACIFFASISGSSPATVAAIGNMMYPALVKEGYTERYAIGALATAGSIGILIPPSIPLVLYGFITETSIPDLFIAGIVPGIIYGAAMMVAARFLARKEKYKLRERIAWPMRFGAVRDSVPALTLPLFIIVGIYGFPEFDIGSAHFAGGAIFTPTEAAVMASALALLIGFFLYRELKLRDIPGAFVHASARVGMIFWIAANAVLFGFFITKLGVPKAVTEVIVAMELSRVQFLLIVNLFLIVVGFFLEGVPTILIFIPILFPAAEAVGVDPVHFGIITVVNIELGLVTPPVGLNLFVGSGVSGLPVMSVFRATIPWMVATVFALLLVTYVPEISLFLPRLMNL
ncbi:MAG: TRAP transporter large permease [Betaproteobacteria bacterium]|nr:TRAP transporter large permease [Betaproteobacteria bacterium]MDH3436220.1 TRAP transporter large permease [Betaproteobacteria bacterium]